MYCTATHQTQSQCHTITDKQQKLMLLCRKFGVRTEFNYRILFFVILTFVYIVQVYKCTCNCAHFENMYQQKVIGKKKRDEIQVINEIPIPRINSDLHKKKISNENDNFEILSRTVTVSTAMQK